MTAKSKGLVGAHAMCSSQKMNMELLFILHCLVISSFAFQAKAQFSGGSGESNDPYQIATAEQLIGLGEDPNLYDKHFVLTADIDLDPSLPGRKVFDRAVIAPDVNEVEERFQGIPFTGTFDGNHHVIRNVHIQGSSYLGLFGQLDSTAVISHLGLEDGIVNGSGDYIGGLVGNNGGPYSWSTGGILVECYSTCTITGDTTVGGLVGWNRGSITRSWSTGTIAGKEGVGGLVGANYTSPKTSVLCGGVMSCGGRFCGEGDFVGRAGGRLG